MDKYRMEVERGKTEQSGKSSQYGTKVLKVFFITVMVMVSFIAWLVLIAILYDMGYQTMAGILVYGGFFAGFFFLLIRPLQKYGVREYKFKDKDAFDSDIGGEVSGRWAGMK